MPVVITDNVALGTLNAGYLRPHDKAKIAEANELTPEQVAELSAPDLLQAMVAADIDAPNIVNALSAAGISAPSIISALSSAGIDAPNIVNALNAAGIDAPNIISALSAAGIGSPNQLTPEQIAALSAPNVITPKALPSAPYPFTHARILYDNVLKQSEVAQLDQNGNPIGIGSAGNLITDNTYERYLTTSSNDRAVQFLFSQNQSLDCFCLGAHNLGTAGATLRILTSADASGGSFVNIGEVTPTNNRAIMLLLSSPITVRRVRFSFAGTSNQRIAGNASAGIALAMQRPIFGGHNPITMSRQTTYNNRRTESGNFVSRSIIRSGLSGNYEWSNLSDDWVRSQFDPFVRAARILPFYIAWRPADYPDEVAYAWTTGDISPSNQGVRNLMSVGMEVQAYGD